MLKLKDIRREYVTGDMKVQALNGVSIAFRRKEFVAILGPSGCGKTTLLNVIGGLDRYTDGELEIKGRSTTEYTDRDWDSYRNHSIGFVFQSYNLIPHQTVLANVELALTLSGVSASEREKRAREALERVGLGDQLKKKPGEMSGGQMQRVAIARALVNDPEIVLADEPTGALDSETSLQIMEVLQEIARDRLVIMVTHNGELAERYATRTVRLLDGRVIGDTDPFDGEEEAAAQVQTGKTSMGFSTALRLSLNNLMTKKGRTFLVALAGSIGIIGIALILSLSTGVDRFISSVEGDTMAQYPLTIEAETVDSAGVMLTMMTSVRNRPTGEREEGRIYSSNVAGEMLNNMISEVGKNDLAAFRDYLETTEDTKGLLSSVEYEYLTTLKIYNPAPAGGGILQVNPSTLIDKMTGSSIMSDVSGLAAMSGMGGANRLTSFYNLDAFFELKDSRSDSWHMLCGRMPEAYDEVVLVTGENRDLSDLVLYTLGLRDQAEVGSMFNTLLSGKQTETAEAVSYSYDDLMNLRFSLVLPGNLYEQNALGGYASIEGNSEKLQQAVENGVQLKVTGIAYTTNSSLMTAIAAGGVGYTHDLVEYAVTANNETPVVKAQREDPETDVFTGLRFDGTPAEMEVSMEMVDAWLDTLDEEQAKSMRAMIALMGEEQILNMAKERLAGQKTNATYEGNMGLLNATELSTPSRISLYPLDFESKEKITKLIADYNERAEQEGREDQVIRYTDYVGSLMSSVTDIVDAISYVLIAFVSVSLVVSSIMIGSITYISVLERTREIGILRALGASRKDVSRVFTAETLIIGFAAGLIGIGATLLLTIPINMIIRSLTSVKVAAQLPVAGGVILVAISMLLTILAGAIPSRMAARKNPVEALRTE